MATVPKLARDLSGTKFGQWEVVAYFGKPPKRSGTMWVCRHSCGATATVRGDRITAGVQPRCECKRLVYRSFRTFRYGQPKELKSPPKNAIDLVGHRFGRWLVLAYAGLPTTGRGSVWLCRCDCGNECAVRGTALRSGDSTSCGCAHKDRLAERGRNRVGSPEYAVWSNMKQRCLNENHPHFHLWGGRGITVCDRWADSFDLFLADMGERPTPKHELDRIDNSKGYEPGNCRWATSKEQLRNTRRTRMITFGGVTMCLTDWAAKLGLSAQCLTHRLKVGWPLEKALTSAKLRN